MSGARALSATASSGLGVTFSSLTPDICTVSATTLSMTWPGECRVIAEQPGNNTYAGASVEHTYTVRPDSAANPTLVLDPASDTGSVDYLSWIEGARPVVNLADDVLNGAGSILEAINRLDDLAGTPLTQNSDTGEMELHLPEFVASVLPVHVTQAPADVAAGLYITDDGDVLFVTDSDRAVLSYPVVIGKEPFRVMIDEEELTLEVDERANLRGSHPELDFYFSVRPDLVSLPTHRHSQPGVFEHPMPGFDRELGMSFLFEEDGVLHEQDLVPTSPDWFALKDALLAIEEITSVRIDMQGIIHAVLDGEPVQARLSYRVYIDVEAEAEHATIRPIGDQTGNGLPDFEVVYPNGEVQGLFPQRGNHYE